MSRFSNEVHWQAGAHRTTASWQHESCFIDASASELLSIGFAGARSVKLPRVSLTAQMRAMMTKMSNERLHTSWLLMPALASIGCGSLWSPFLGDNPICQTDPATCAPPSDIGVSDGGVGADMMEPEVRPNLVMVRKGSFMMGSPTGEVGRNTNEVQHSITLTTDFWMAESEVTQKQYRNLVGSNPSAFKGAELPVEQVSWFDAVAYCNALSVKEKLQPCYQISGTTVGWADGVKCTGYRLPTEAEWEYAANPATPPRTVYAGSDTVDGVAWYGTNSMSTTHAVKTKTANGRGLYDLSGNVFEWVWDWYQANYETLPATDPIGPSTGTFRVLRGGSWGGPAADARVSGRHSLAPTNRINGGLGFRFVRSNP